LKPVHLHHSTVNAQGFPRRIRRGLIEARLVHALGGLLAEFPRRIRRGLIEASVPGAPLHS